MALRAHVFPEPQLPISSLLLPKVSNKCFGVDDLDRRESMDFDDLQREQVSGILSDDVVSAAFECGGDDVVVFGVRRHQVDLIRSTCNVGCLKQCHEEVAAVLPNK